MPKTRIVLSSACSDKCCCPVAEQLGPGGAVKIHDPEVPARGSFTMSAEEWDRLLRNGRLAQRRSKKRRRKRK